MIKVFPPTPFIGGEKKAFDYGSDFVRDKDAVTCNLLPWRELVPIAKANTVPSTRINRCFCELWIL